MPGELRAMQRPHAADRCQARNPSTCKFHGSTPDAAANRGDVNAYIDAKLSETVLSKNDMDAFFQEKTKYPKGYASLETLQFNGEVLDVNDLNKKTGMSHFVLHEVITRPITGTKHHPTEEHKNLRFKAALFNHRLSESVSEISNKEFGRFTTRKAKDAYYAEKVEEIQKLAKNAKQSAEASIAAETSKALTPVQKGEHYEIEAGGVRLYDEGYIPEYLAKEEADVYLANVATAYKTYKETGVFKLNPWNGITSRG